MFDAPRSPQTRHVISAPIDLENRPAQISLNIDDLSEHGQVTVEILDEYFRPLAGYTAEHCQPLESGLQQPVRWNNQEWVEHRDEAIRIRLNFAGIRPEDPKLYAIYVTSAV